MKLIITFFGHRDFIGTEEYENKLFAILENLIGRNAVEFYLGGYGNGDAFFYQCCKKYQLLHQNAKLIFITPYLLSNDLQDKTKKYDLVIYPELEKVPPKFAILHRNRYMIDKADIVITCIQYTKGGAYQAYLYAKKQGKTIIELQTEKFPLS